MALTGNTIKTARTVIVGFTAIGDALKTTAAGGAKIGRAGIAVFALRIVPFVDALIG